MEARERIYPERNHFAVTHAKFIQHIPASNTVTFVIFYSQYVTFSRS